MSGPAQLQREIEAAQLLRDQLAALAGDDEEVIRDTLEGATNLREIIRDVLASTGEDEAMLAGIDTYIEGLTARKRRIKDRVEYKRSLMTTALEVAGLPKLETDIATVSLSKVQPKVIVTDEAAIPTEFWKASEPTLDKKALGAALKDGREIPGCELSNGGATVTIRRK